MGRNKLFKFAENQSSYNVIQEGKSTFHEIKGEWRSRHFKNEHELVLELACGYGEYSTGLARLFPGKNFIGIDIKGSRIWRGSRIAEDEVLLNVAFLRSQIQHLENFFAENEVNEIWIIFPDPQPKNREIKKRLTHPKYLNIYKNILAPSGWVKFKTDNEGLFNYTIKALESRKDILDLESTTDLYQSPLQQEHYDIKTRYERMFVEAGSKIKYLKFRFK